MHCRKKRNVFIIFLHMLYIKYHKICVKSEITICLAGKYNYVPPP